MVENIYIETCERCGKKFKANSVHLALVRKSRHLNQCEGI